MFKRGQLVKYVGPTDGQFVNGNTYTVSSSSLTIGADYVQVAVTDDVEATVPEIMFVAVNMNEAKDDWSNSEVIYQTDTSGTAKNAGVVIGGMYKCLQDKRRFGMAMILIRAPLGDYWFNKDEFSLVPEATNTRTNLRKAWESPQVQWVNVSEPGLTQDRVYDVYEYDWDKDLVGIWNNEDEIIYLNVDQIVQIDEDEPEEEQPVVASIVKIPVPPLVKCVPGSVAASQNWFGASSVYSYRGTYPEDFKVKDAVGEWRTGNEEGFELHNNFPFDPGQICRLIVGRNADINYRAIQDLKDIEYETTDILEDGTVEISWELASGPFKGEKQFRTIPKFFLEYVREADDSA